MKVCFLIYSVDMKFESLMNFRAAGDSWILIKR